MLARNLDWRLICLKTTSISINGQPPGQKYTRSENSQRSDAPNVEKMTIGKEQAMGDKGGKKDKEKGKKQVNKKHEQKVKKMKDKQPKRP